MINDRAAAVTIRPPSVSERIRDENRFFMRIVLQYRHCNQVKGARPKLPIEKASVARKPPRPEPERLCKMECRSLDQVFGASFFSVFLTTFFVGAFLCFLAETFLTGLAVASAGAAVVVAVEAAGAAVVVAAALPRAGMAKARATPRPRAERMDFFMASFPFSCRSG
ncbi:hypothetical protein MPLA_160003 [Mesorhizobium sp. ORS 3359]|nr:hypothetical protein MPLA_160003 [Mesorhizobium sp. ORS 3359]